MAEIDNTIALGIKPQPPQDIIGPITSLAQLQYLQAHGALESGQAQLQQMRISGINQLNDAVANGTPIEQALPGSTYGLLDPTGGTAVLNNVTTGRTLGANAAFAKSGNPNDLAIVGPAQVTEGAKSIQSLRDLKANAEYASTGDPTPLQVSGPAAYGAGVTAQKTGGEVATQKFAIAGQVANGILAMGDVQGNMPAGGIPPAIKADAINKLLAAGSISPQQAAQLRQMGDGDVWNMAKSVAARGQSVTEAATTSGRAAAATAAGTHSNTPIQKTPGNSIELPQAADLPASGVRAPTASGVGLPAAAPAPGARVPVAAPASAGAPSPNYYGQVSTHESGNNPSAINPNGGAAGLYQFMPGTWQNLMKTHPELGLTPNGALDSRQSTMAMQAFTMDNAQVLSRAGIPVNDKNLFMAHFLGAGGATKFLQAGAQNPNASAADLFPNEAKQNPTIFYNGSQPRSLGEVYGIMTNRFGPGLTATNVGSGPAAGFSPQPMQMPAGANGAPPAAVGLLGAGLVQPQAQGSGNPLAPPPPPQLGVAPIANVAAPPVAPIAASAAVPPAVTSPAAPAVTVPPAGPVPVASPAPSSGLGMKVLSPGMSLADKAAAEETGKGLAAANVKQFADAKERYQYASTAQMKLGELQASLDEMPKSGFLVPGPGAKERFGLARLANTIVGGLGSKPVFDPAVIGAGENAQKLTGSLGFDTSKALGSNEAARITEAAIQLNPGFENSDMGASIVAGGINAGFQRDRDFYKFLAQNQNTPNADLEFDKIHPPVEYIKESQALARLPPKAIKILQNNPALAPQFDARYGPGLSRYFTGQ